MARTKGVPEGGWEKQPDDPIVIMQLPRNIGFPPGQPPLPVHCVECPLRRDAAPGWLGGYSPEEYILLMHSDARVACHLSPGFHEKDWNQQRHCTGVAAYRANTCKRPRDTAANEAVDQIGKDTKKYFGTAQEFLDHHRRVKK